MKILGTGLTGLVGSRLVELLDSAYEFEFINSQHGVNLLDRQAVLDTISSSEARVVLHMAAKTNVDGCELDMQDDKNAIQSNDFTKAISKQSAWAVNVLGTQNIVDACKKSGKKIVYVSTDFVFSGQKKSYCEDDKPEPINWYAKTKYEGEKVVQNSGLDFIIARPAYPYRAFFQRGDVVRSLISKLEKNEEINMITDHIMKPTFIDDLVNALDILIKTEQVGIFHVTGSQSVTPYQLAIKIAKEFGFNQSLVRKTTRSEYFQGKAPRPFCLNLKNDKIGKLGIEMSTVDKGLIEIKNQLAKIKI